MRFILTSILLATVFVTAPALFPQTAQAEVIRPGNNAPDSFADLEAATAACLQGNYTPTGNNCSFFFRGKAMIIPEIQVYLNDREHYIPIGTTLRQLVEMSDDVTALGT